MSSVLRPPTRSDEPPVSSYSHFDELGAAIQSQWHRFTNWILSCLGALRYFRWSVIWDKLYVIWIYARYYIWVISTKLVIAIVYVSVIRDGVVSLVPQLGLRLSHLPGLDLLANYKATYRLDLAFVFSLLLLVAIIKLWDLTMTLYCFGRDEVLPLFEDGDAYAARRETVTILLGACLLIVDGGLFYNAMLLQSWSDTRFSFTALLVTVGYVSVLVFFSYVTVNMRQRIKELES